MCVEGRRHIKVECKEEQKNALQESRTENRQKETRGDDEGLDNGRMSPSNHRPYCVNSGPESLDRLVR